MLQLVLTIIGFTAAMSVPVFLTSIAESAASKKRPDPCDNRARYA